MNFYKYFFYGVVAQMVVSLGFSIYASITVLNSIKCTGSAGMCADFTQTNTPLAIQLIAVLAVLDLLVIGIGFGVYKWRNRIATGLFALAEILFAVSAVQNLTQPETYKPSLIAAIIFDIVVAGIAVLAIVKYRPASTEPAETTPPTIS